MANHCCQLCINEGNIDDVERGSVTSEELDRAQSRGKWGSEEPSDLFLRMYHDALSTLDEKPEISMVSPSLMGSSGTMPLAIISVIPDIVRHMSNLIVRAEQEVVLATNFWQNSAAARYIVNAIRELSRRAGDRGARVVIKIIYDRGSPKQLLEPHYVVPECEYTARAVGLPAPDDIPNVDLEVMNYHQPILGTFHSKYMIVDRRIGILQSNNIQDNDNLEMMVQVEGPIVDSLYDMALRSWHKEMDPPLPRRDCPAAEAAFTSFDESHAGIFSPEGTIKGHSAIVDPNKMPRRKAYVSDAIDQARPAGETSPRDGTNEDAITRDTENPSHVNVAKSSLQSQYGRTEYQELQSQGPAGTAALDEMDHHQAAPQKSPIETAAEPLLEHTPDDPHYDDDLAGEIQRLQAALRPKAGETPMQAVTRHLNHTVNAGFERNAPECDSQDAMTPYVPHPAHAAFPMALVCRAPHGPPTHASASCPQNAAWLSALRNARHSVFIQTPTLNAEPLLPAIVDACGRGVDVYCYVCLGYNDSGELLPMQGGHNEMIAHRLYASLSPSAKQHLHYFWYVAKDQTAPIVAERKRRSCHIKLMIVDERVGIVGNGNQDTQSWYHSQEVNIMLESSYVCRAWVEALRRNQNTHIYGGLDAEEGVWKDAQGRQADGAMGVDPGRFSWARGFIGAIKRVQGTGGF
ncbi:IQ calmodulin-binding motif protein [Xylariaceae sp. FL0662B]|nr:IQ calmodulin-binding motif protein [Xylariaceae sp. FL0662B]